MAKYAIDKYPKGSYKGQQSDGKYIEGYLKSNLDVLAKNIVNDMTFLGVVYSSTLEVGTGKSVFVQHVGEYWTEAMKTIHNIDVPFTIDNIVFRPKDLIERSFQLPKYSVIILDEWEEAGWFSELGMSLREFFRRCRQLNLFMLIIIPNFFQLPKAYAISRSVFAIDVRFEGEFDRGYFRFYNFDKKKDLYIKGKKTENYNVVTSDFKGRFLDGYPVGDKEYRDAKYRAFAEQDEGKDKPTTKEQVMLDRVRVVDKLILEGFSKKKSLELCGMASTTYDRWKVKEIPREIPLDNPTAPQY